MLQIFQRTANSCHYFSFVQDSGKLRTVLLLVVVAAEGLAVDEGERGDDEDDAGRCRSDDRGQPSTAFAAAERVGGTVARAGVDIAREREKRFRECPLLSSCLVAPLGE